MSKIKICFVAQNAYGALTDDHLQHVGGIERQQAMMARWMAGHGHDVSVITWGQDCTKNEQKDGVNLRFLCNQSDGLPVLKFFHPRWTSLVAALQAADADLYYYNLGDLGLGQIVAWAKRANKKVMYSVASESVCHGDLRQVLSVRERLFYQYGLRRVDSIVVQTSTQQKLLRTDYNLDSSVLPMPCEDLSVDGSGAAPPSPPRRPRVVWVGRLSTEKRPEWVLDIAEKCPTMQFIVVGQANRDTEYATSFLTRAEGMENVEIRGVVQHTEIAAVYCDAQAILCTSEYEGFPNVFLEAWSLGLPVVTSFDPDSIVRANDLGVVGTDVEQLADGLKLLTTDSSYWAKCSGNARNYFAEKHSLDHAMQGFVEHMLHAVGSARVAPSD